MVVLVQRVWLVVDVTISMQLVEEGCVNVNMVSFIPMVIVVSKSELSKSLLIYYHMKTIAFIRDYPLKYLTGQYYLVQLYLNVLTLFLDSVKLMFFLVQRVPLNRPCTVDDICIDENADCFGGYCVCRPTHFELNGECGKWFLRLP